MGEGGKAVPVSEFLDVGLLASLPSLEFRARFLVSGFLSGLHGSPYRGSRVEFKEFRDYQPGDSLRSVDWKLYARTDRLHVRLHQDESNMNVHILLDYSMSMSYRGGAAVLSKWDYARSLAAAVALFLSRQGDAFSLSLAGLELNGYDRPSSTQAHFQHVLSRLHREADAPGCDWGRVLDVLLGLVRKRSIVLVISDFYSDPELFEPHLNRMRYLNCEPVFINVMDPSELDFDFDGPLLLSEMEGGSRLRMSPDLIRREYLAALGAHAEKMADMLGRYGGEYLRLRTDEQPLRALSAYLNARGRRK